MISWPNDLIEAVARRRVVLFLGAGVSMNAENDQNKNPPSWRAVLEAGIEKCDGTKSELRRLLKDGDYLSCCQILKTRMKHGWVSFLEDQFIKPKFKSAAIHEAIFELDASIVLTPNFDRIYDDYAQKKTENRLKIKKFFDDDIPRSLRGGVDHRLILKVHGCIDTPDKLIFTRAEYASARHTHHSFYRALDALFLTHTFLFIGCSMSDPDLCLLLEQYTHSFSGSPPHYVLLSGKHSDDYKSLLSSNYNLEVLPYSPADNHRELLQSINDLKSKVATMRDVISEKHLW